MTILTPARSCQTSVAQLHYTYISLADAFIQSNSQKGNTTSDSALKGNMKHLVIQMFQTLLGTVPALIGRN